MHALFRKCFTLQISFDIFKVCKTMFGLISNYLYDEKAC